MLADLTIEELAAGLDAVVNEILVQAGLNAPPVDAFSLAQIMGITIALDNCQEGRARYVRLCDRRASQPRATILLRADPRQERQQWAVAHEIGEHVAHRVFAVLGVDPRESPANAREQVANQLAGRLLVPSRWFGRDAGRWGWDLIALKQRYNTASHELIARRMLECRPAVIITIFDQGRISFRRSNLPGRPPPLSPAESTCWKWVHDNNQSRETYSGTCSVKGWPIHEDGWKREILRMELTEEEFFC
jgi:hypothetical protein